MKLWEVLEGGESVWIVGFEEAQILGMWIEHHMMSGNEWPEEKPEMRKLKDHEQFKYVTSADRKVLRLTAREWCELIGKPQFLGTTAL